ncbi:hypothetical protein PVAND_013697 [Polypedilum vanderplanki]|uniref:Uncharacterized protein n=1 Tax=Polypedilum vanderplanki TaxID=319348 RepID=A0A9J6CRH9_POLVA|nr:hypothetical protein PVAND_013697 [Polypedilum vanderplanki]
MNVAKELVKILGLSKQVSIFQMLARLQLKFNHFGLSKLKPTGVIIDDRVLKSDFYLLFCYQNDIEDFKKCCFKEDGVYKVALFNSCFQVEFSSQKKRMNLDDMKDSDMAQNELKIKKEKEMIL